MNLLKKKKFLQYEVNLLKKSMSIQRYLNCCNKVPAYSKEPVLYASLAVHLVFNSHFTFLFYFFLTFFGLIFCLSFVPLLCSFVHLSLLPSFFYSWNTGLELLLDMLLKYIPRRGRGSKDKVTEKQKSKKKKNSAFCMFVSRAAISRGLNKD